MTDERNPKAVQVLSKAKAYADAKYQEGKNNDTIFGEWYGLNHQPWCAMFVSKCFDEAGLVKLVAASGKKGFAGIPLAIIVGALGAAQLAMVASPSSIG